MKDGGRERDGWREGGRRKEGGRRRKEGGRRREEEGGKREGEGVECIEQFGCLAL